MTITVIKGTTICYQEHQHGRQATETLSHAGLKQRQTSQPYDRVFVLKGTTIVIDTLTETESIEALTIEAFQRRLRKQGTQPLPQSV